MLRKLFIRILVRLSYFKAIYFILDCNVDKEIIVLILRVECDFFIIVIFKMLVLNDF